MAEGPDFEADQCSEPRPGCTKRAIVQEQAQWQEMTNPSGRRRLEDHLPLAVSLRGEPRGISCGHGDSLSWAGSGSMD